MILVLRLSDFNSPSWCSLRLCTEVHGSKVNSIVVAGGLTVVFLLGKEIHFRVSPLLQVKKGFVYPGSWSFVCSTPQVKVCKYKFLISKDWFSYKLLGFSNKILPFDGRFSLQKIDCLLMAGLPFSTQMRSLRDTAPRYTGKHGFHSTSLCWLC